MLGGAVGRLGCGGPGGRGGNSLVRARPGTPRPGARVTAEGWFAPVERGRAAAGAPANRDAGVRHPHRGCDHRHHGRRDRAEGPALQGLRGGAGDLPAGHPGRLQRRDGPHRPVDPGGAFLDPHGGLRGAEGVQRRGDHLAGLQRDRDDAHGRDRRRDADPDRAGGVLVEIPPKERGKFESASPEAGPRPGRAQRLQPGPVRGHDHDHAGGVADPPHRAPGSCGSSRRRSGAIA